MGAVQLKTLFASALVIALSAPAQADWRLCFPNSSTAPNVADGSPFENPGSITPGSAPQLEQPWRTAFRFVNPNGLADDDGTDSPDAAFSGVRSGSDVYLAIEVEGSVVDNSDSILLAFDPQRSGNNRPFFKIEVQPNADAYTPASNPHAAQLVRVWNSAHLNGGSAGTVNWDGVTAVDSGHGITANVWLKDQESWTVELKIPGSSTLGAALNAANASIFGLYVNIMPCGPGEENTECAEYPWPPDTPLIMGDFWKTTPAVATWGLATINAAWGCGGVSVTKVKTQNTPDNQVTLNADNQLTAEITNTMTNGEGTPAVANGVTARYEWAYYGISGPQQWNLAATAGPTTVPANAVGFGLSATWPVNLTPPSGAHPCMRVVLDAAGDDPVVFINRTIQRNMVFRTASAVEVEANIDLRHIRFAPGVEPRLELEATTKALFLPKGASSALAQFGLRPQAAKPTAQFVKLHRAFVSTGQFVDVKHKDGSVEHCQLRRSVGGFGLVLHHVLARPHLIEKWQTMAPKLLDPDIFKRMEALDVALQPVRQQVGVNPLIRKKLRRGAPAVARAAAVGRESLALALSREGTLKVPVRFEFNEGPDTPVRPGEKETPATKAAPKVDAPPPQPSCGNCSSFDAGFDTAPLGLLLLGLFIASRRRSRG